MYKSDFCKIDFLEKYNAIYCQWKNYCKFDEYRKPLEYGLKLINEKKATVWITDTSNGFESTDEDTSWLIDEFIPKTINSTCDTIVFIIKNNSPLKDEINNQAKALAQYFRVIQIDNIELLNNYLENGYKYAN